MRCKIDLICNIHIDDLINEIVLVTGYDKNSVEFELNEEYLMPSYNDDIIYQNMTLDPDHPSWIYDVIDSILAKINDFDEVRIFK